MSQSVTSVLATVSGRQRALTAALIIAKGTMLEPKDFERRLLDQFVRGELTIDQVMECLEK